MLNNNDINKTKTTNVDYVLIETKPWVDESKIETDILNIIYKFKKQALIYLMRRLIYFCLCLHFGCYDYATENTHLLEQCTFNCSTLPGQDF